MADLTGAAFEPLPLGSVRPAGWLRDQLLAQARGLTGRLEQVWPDVGPSSGWLGGPGECWERGPYYLDGLVPLAWVLDDAALQATAQKWVEWTLASQRDDGFFGPAANRDWWPRMVMLSVLLSYHSATSDQRVPPFVERSLRYAYQRLPEQPLEMWAAARGGQMLPAVLWCHRRCGQPWLLELAALLVRQSTDWTAFYRDFPYAAPAASAQLGRLLRAYLPARTRVENLIRRWRPAKRARPRTAAQVERAGSSAALRFYHRTHGVNHAMALRGTAYAALVTGADPAAAARLADDTIARHHGSVVGVVTADEHLAGRSPVHGIETCSVVETMRSCEELVRITGDGHWGDRLEEVAFNALPAALTADLMGHQYYQQVTQVEVSRRWRPWFNGGTDGTLFGLEPTYGCCTANLHQGWPRLAASAVLRSSDGGLAVATLVPCTVTASVAGVDVRLDVATDYPFDGLVRVQVAFGEVASARFPLRLRVPAWGVGATLHVNGEPAVPDVRDGFAVLTREWLDGDVVTLRLPLVLRLDGAPVGGEAAGEPDRGVVVRRGPLVLALALPERWRARGGRHGVPDWEVRTAAAWTYGIAADALAEADISVREVPRVPFDHERPAVEVVLPARPINGWRARHGSAGSVPELSDRILGRPEPVRLVPYGCTALRVSVLPLLPASR
jgi:uncharacterized protein